MYSTLSEEDGDTPDGRKDGDRFCYHLIQPSGTASLISNPISRSSFSQDLDGGDKTCILQTCKTANMSPSVLVLCTLCALAFASEKLSYEEILLAAKAGEMQDSVPTAPDRINSEHDLEGMIGILMFIS